MVTFSNPYVDWWNFQSTIDNRMFYTLDVCSKRPDLTPRQIEWCRAHIPMFAEMQRLRGVK